MIPPVDFKPGFRLSAVDVAILIGGILGTVILGQHERWLGISVGFVVGHFFLFCNVFRISRRPELIWAAVFTALGTSTMVTDRPGWISTVAVSFVLTVVLIGLEMRKPSYHGIFWKQLNPGLRERWARDAAKQPS